MALGQQDILQHNNPNLAVVDSKFVRGGRRSVADRTALYALAVKADQLEENVTIVRILSDSANSNKTTEVILVNKANAGQGSGWQTYTSGSNQGGDLTKADADTYYAPFSVSSAVSGLQSGVNQLQTDIATKAAASTVLALQSELETVSLTASEASDNATAALSTANTANTNANSAISGLAGKANTSDIPTSTDNLTEGSTNKYFTSARVLATVLSGLDVVSGTPAATDTLLQAWGKVVYFFTNIATTVRNTTFSGYTKAGSAAAISDSDTAQTAAGKLEKKLDDNTDIISPTFTAITYASSFAIAVPASGNGKYKMDLTGNTTLTGITGQGEKVVHLRIKGGAASYTVTLPGTYKTPVITSPITVLANSVLRLAFETVDGITTVYGINE